jgi:ketosteroid isomerase-like protein
MDENPTHQQRMELALTGLAAGDATELFNLFADDITWHVKGSTPWSGSYRGKRTVLRFLRDLSSQMSAPMRVHARRILVAGDDVIVEARGDCARPDGTRYDNEYCWLCRFVDGRLHELTEYMDTELTQRVLRPPSS